MSEALEKAVSRLASRAAATESDIQGDIRALLLYGGLNLDDDDISIVSEAQAGGGRRIDIEAGYTIIEIKKGPLASKPNEKAVAVEQLGDYLTLRTVKTGQRYNGMLTDGVSWFLYHRGPDGSLTQVDEMALDPQNPNSERLTVWIEGVLATAQQITPTPHEVEQRLGYRSPGYLLELAELRNLYDQCASQPSVKLKRELWARLLGTALGEHFQDDDELFIRHTYLVVVAELIAHAAVGLEIGTGSQDGYTLLSGELFRNAGISGVVEADFFDWPVEPTGGDLFVKGLARRVARFDWRQVEHDVLKVLYESVIDAETRKSLGEYYTPDWLAERIVTEVVIDPLNQKVLDPACGSGTFLFWAVRRYLEAAELSGLSNQEAINGVSRQVYGVDLHPVAVTLARVTYLLAIGLERLQDRDHLSVPVYLGDSIQWEESHSLLTSHGLTVYTTDGVELFAQELFFPDRTLADVTRFDRLVSDLTNAATSRKPHSPEPSIDTILSRHSVHPDDRAAVSETFSILCKLYDEGRNHIWGYYVRNRARPMWLSRSDNWVDVLIGNPPWLSYRYMDRKMQTRFRELSEERQLWAGAEVTTNQDLSALFVVRSSELYLKQGGSFGFVMPAAALSRRQFRGFRTGHFVSKKSPSSKQAPVAIQFDQPWNLTGINPTIFPVPPSVVFGRRSTNSKAMQSDASTWRGQLDHHHHTWDEVASRIEVEDQATTIAEDSPKSPYERIFSQGATLVPSVLIRVEKAPVGPLGVPAGKIAIQSARSNLEKAPWKQLPSLTGTVEGRFVHPIYLGTSIAPFRVFKAGHAVVPWVGGELVDGNNPRIETDPGLAAWWRSAEGAWEANKGSGTSIGLVDQIDYRRKLVNQFPISEHRVVYTASGANLVAARLEDVEGVVEHALYWGPVGSVEEAQYLISILNSKTLLAHITPLQAVGQFGPRHFDKYVFAVPFPLYNPDDSLHVRLAGLGARAETVAAGVELSDGVGFRKARSLITEALSDADVTSEIENAVNELLDPQDE